MNNSSTSNLYVVLLILLSLFIMWQESNSLKFLPYFGRTQLTPCIGFYIKSIKTYNFNEFNLFLYCLPVWKIVGFKTVRLNALPKRVPLIIDESECLTGGSLNMFKSDVF